MGENGQNHHILDFFSHENAFDYFISQNYYILLLPIIKHIKMTSVSNVLKDWDMEYSIFMILYTKNVFLQQARYGNIQHIIAYSAFNNHICCLSSMNPHSIGIIIIENEYCMH